MPSQNGEQISETLLEEEPTDFEYGYKTSDKFTEFYIVYYCLGNHVKYEDMVVDLPEDPVLSPKSNFALVFFLFILPAIIAFFIWGLPWIKRITGMFSAGHSPPNNHPSGVVDSKANDLGEKSFISEEVTYL